METATLQHIHPLSATPIISSPLASSSVNVNFHPQNQPPTAPKRTPSFPRSRPLRPFASITGSFLQSDIDAFDRSQISTKNRPVLAEAITKLNIIKNDASKPVKMIEAPKNFNGGFFILNLTQAELSRKD